MMSQDAEGAGSVGALTTIANSAQSGDDPLNSVHTVRATHTNPRSASSRGLPYHHLPHTPQKRHLPKPHSHPHGVASACATTQDMKRWTAQQGSCAATAVIGGTYSSCELISVTTLQTSSCTEKTTNWWTPAFTVMARVEVKLTSILRGG